MKKRLGWSLVELLVVLAVLGVLLALAAPRFRRSLEQARADAAAANLRAIWAAQRLYWLDNHRYAGNLADLAPLLDPSVTVPGPFYSYSIQSADATTFRAAAVRTGSSTWSGQLTVDESGAVSGSIQASGQSAITPGFQ